MIIIVSANNVNTHVGNIKFLHITFLYITFLIYYLLVSMFCPFMHKTAIAKIGLLFFEYL